ncbi:uncharacterized protein [Apostichopus japonicus]|uniref:uncharacterized protein isoform X1 n=1 Tax=Stichopus japonicus TaxID=307972 RepID=UPI003AB418F7
MDARFAMFVICFTLSSALTDDEIADFGTTGMPESNTGIVGYVTVTDNGDSWTFESNGVPDHDTGLWPGINPNSIQAQNNVYTVPKNPVFADSPSCLPGGPIAMAVNGVMLFNPWNAFDENAVEGDTAEVFDECDGHPDQRGTYHYHKMPASCLFEDVGGEPSPLIGVAFDGFAIYGPNDENGNRLTSADLDECHGRTNSDGVYQYHTTTDFPYILGCYKGTSTRMTPPGGNCYFASDANSLGNIQTGGNEPEENTVPAPTTASNWAVLRLPSSLVILVSSVLAIMISRS